jgi:iron complex transport system substrate-binding protein
LDAIRLWIGVCAASFVTFVTLIALPSIAHADHYPVTVQSCQRQVMFQHAPRRAVSNDVNLTEMMLALGLKDRMIGYTGISGWSTGNKALRQSLKGLPELARRYPSTEVLVGAGADFYFAGWNYGMRVGDAVTPTALASFGIQVYELSESCSHIMSRPAASFDDVYRDIANLGLIFDVGDRADAVITAMRDRLKQVSRQLGPHLARVPVLVYDSGEDTPMTAGRLAMPTALIAQAGGRNVLDDVAKSWMHVSWESVVERNPQVIVIIDYGAVSAEHKRQFLLAQPALARVDAIRHRRFIVLPYDEATPGIRNVNAVETLARGLHPAAFPS